MTGLYRHRPAFTLVEMVVVLVLMAMLAGAAVFSLSAPLKDARMKRLLASIEDADRRARTEARRSSELVELTIDGSRSSATQTIVSGQRRSELRRSLPFTGGLHIDRVVTARRSANEERHTVRYGPSGQSDTYAVRLKADRDDPQSSQRWLVVVGATGQFIRSNEDSAVAAIVSKQR